MKKFMKLFLVFVLGLAIMLPMQVSSINAQERGTSTLRKYYITDTQTQYGIRQYYIKELCPVDFKWYDNGIPDVVMFTVSSNEAYFVPDRITDTGYGIVDSGVYFRKFGAIMNDGRTVYFWAHANNKIDLVYI